VAHPSTPLIFCVNQKELRVAHLFDFAQGRLLRSLQRWGSQTPAPGIWRTIATLQPARLSSRCRSNIVRPVSRETGVLLCRSAKRALAILSIIFGCLRELLVRRGLDSRLGLGFKVGAWIQGWGLASGKDALRSWLRLGRVQGSFASPERRFARSDFVQDDSVGGRWRGSTRSPSALLRAGSGHELFGGI
jgi:hypothetical protein